MKFERCIYCFAESDGDGPCPVCGYADGLCEFPVQYLLPGSILKGRYMVGKQLRTREKETTYLGWDLTLEGLVEITEYYPPELVTRDVTRSDDVVIRPGAEEAFASGCREFEEKVRLFVSCISRIKDVRMDFFSRNRTCYYAREAKDKKND